MDISENAPVMASFIHDNLFASSPQMDDGRQSLPYPCLSCSMVLTLLPVSNDWSCSVHRMWKSLFEFATGPDRAANVLLHPHITPQTLTLATAQGALVPYLTAVAVKAAQDDAEADAAAAAAAANPILLEHA